MFYQHKSRAFNPELDFLKFFSGVRTSERTSDNGANLDSFLIQYIFIYYKQYYQQEAKLETLKC